MLGPIKCNLCKRKKSIVIYDMGLAEVVPSISYSKVFFLVQDLASRLPSIGDVVPNISFYSALLSAGFGYLENYTFEIFVFLSKSLHG